MILSILCYVPPAVKHQEPQPPSFKTCVCQRRRLKKLYVLLVEFMFLQTCFRIKIIFKTITTNAASATKEKLQIFFVCCCSGSSCIKNLLCPCPNIPLSIYTTKKSIRPFSVYLLKTRRAVHTAICSTFILSSILQCLPFHTCLQVFQQHIES